ncbi:class I SAM-dependent methyltransferase [Paenibacillus sp. HJGM_3]|uniref:class I SAM-dependent methyltransferase n=1 Tax=Paenibacillus sp. HJGM_3 TaxID=3379816 RepID=UPI00385E9BCE
MVETLEVHPSDRLLEIGCGHGVAVSLICSKLTDGTILAIDQSEKMINTAKTQNAPLISEGKARFIAAPLHEADLGPHRFNKIFAQNVNLFWMNAARELAILKERLLPGGAVYLFNQPPAPGKLDPIAEGTKQNLLHAGFSVKSILIGNQMPIPVLCIIGEREDS